MITLIIATFREIVQKLGWRGIFVATALEYACFPISSEILLPFIGCSVSNGGGSLGVAILASTAGGIAGSLFCYSLGRFFGVFLERTVCRKVPSIQKGIHASEKFFRRYGDFSVMIARVFPLVRTYISLPAGMAKIPAARFLFFSGVGALAWNTALIGAGYFLGEHWEEVSVFMDKNKWFLCLILAGMIGVKLYRKKKRTVRKKGN